MRTIDEISLIIKNAFITNIELQQAYDLAPGQTFDEQFAASSFEANIINVFATQGAAIESLLDAHKSDVSEMILKVFNGTVPWVRELIMQFEYNGVKLVEYAAVVEQYPHLLIKINGANYGVWQSDDDVLIALRSYLSKKKVAGTYLSVMSYPPDDVLPSVKVWLDASLYNSTGKHLADGNKKVEEVIDAYLAGVIYNGSMNKTKLIDAIQKVPGVIDVMLEGIQITRADSTIITLPTNENNYQSLGGAFVSTNKNMTYVLD